VNRSLIICDRMILGGLLGVIFFLPFSLAFINISLGIVIISWVVKKFFEYQINPRHVFLQEMKFLSSKMGLALMAIALLIFLTIPFSHFPALSLRKFISRYIQQIFFMYVVSQVVNSRRRLYIILAMLLFSFLLVMVDVAVQYSTGKSIVHHTVMTLRRVTGPMNHPNDLGTLLVTVLPVTLILTLIGFSKEFACLRSAAFKSIMACLFLGMIISLGLSGSRGAWLALAISMISLGIYLKKYKLLILIIFMLAVFFWVFDTHSLVNRVDIYNIPITQGSVLNPSFTNPFGLPSGYNVFKLFFNPTSREFYWNTAADVIRRYPWFGCGYSAYVQTLRDLQVGHEEYPHNSLLHITAELGFIGLILYVWFFTVLILKVREVLSSIARERDLFLIGSALAAGILAWAIHSLMDTAWASLQLSVLWWLFIGIVLSLGLIKQGEKSWPSH